MPAYEYINDTEKFSPEMQINAEEEIACVLFAAQDEAVAARGKQLFGRLFTDEDCQQLSQVILLKVLTVFRPDLVQEAA